MLQRANQKDLDTMEELLESGKVKPVIDRSYTLSELPEALRNFEGGHAQGKVVITVLIDETAHFECAVPFFYKLSLFLFTNT